MKSSYLPSLILLSLITLLGCESKQVVTRSLDKTHAFIYEEFTISQIHAGFENGDFNSEDLTRAYIERIKAIDKAGPELNSVIEVNPDAISIAKDLDKDWAEGNKKGALHGIPVLLKDNIDTHDKMQTTAGSRALLGSKPLQDSYIAEKLRKAGAIILGKANLSEWANFRGDLSSSGWSGVGGQTKNPYILDRNPCGSSAGSGAAVSANLCVFAIGTETNGSIVCPSNNNGIVGIKPTVGLLSRSGIIPISFTQDTPGPMARTVTDAAIALGTMVGIDPRDSKTALSEGKYHEDYTQFLKKDALNGKRIGFYQRPLGQHFKVDALIEETVEYLKSQGAEIIEVDRISTSNLGRGPFDVLLYEFKDGLNTYFASLGPDAPIKTIEDLIEFNESDSIELKYYNQSLVLQAAEKGGLDDEVYQKALAAMEKAYQEDGIDRVMDEHKLDAIIAPTGGPAWKTDWVNGDNFGTGSSTPAARSGYPNITVPMGDIDGLPVGVSFFGRAWSEPVLIEIAYSFEQGTQKRIVPQFKEH